MRTARSTDAVPTKVLSRSWNGDPPAEVRIDVEYTATLDATLFRCANGAGVNVWCRLALTNGRAAERTFAPGLTEIELPTSVAARLRFTLDTLRPTRFGNVFTIETEVPARAERPAPVATGRHP
jgi:hypothetical protein